MGSASLSAKRALARTMQYLLGMHARVWLAVSASLALSCGESAPAGRAADGANAVGSPCVIGAERFPGYTGANVGSFELQEPAAAGQPWCLAYHFQGRSTCPYGQDQQGHAPAGASPCTTPDGQPVIGPGDPTVLPQCVDRRPANVIFWTCKCANEQGHADDGQTYCTCPSSMHCDATLALNLLGTAGTYCSKPAAAYDPSSACSATCAPATAACP